MSRRTSRRRSPPARNRRIFLEQLEGRHLLTSAPISLDDLWYFTGENDTLVVQSTSDGVLDNDFDADDDTLTADVVDEPEHGTLSIDSDGTFSYAPDTDFVGTDFFTYVANDGTDDGNIAYVSISVVPTDEDPEAWISHSLAAEGDPLSFTVTLSRLSVSPVTIEYASTNDTASAGSDYAAVSGELTFEPGETWKQIVVVTHQDFLEEEDDGTLSLNLTSAEGATIVESEGVGTIVNGLPPTDVEITAFYSDGVDLKIDYTLSHPLDWSFTIAVYETRAGLSFREQLALDDALTTAGSHTLTISPTFSDLQTDY